MTAGHHKITGISINKMARAFEMLSTGETVTHTAYRLNIRPVLLFSAIKRAKEHGFDAFKDNRRG